jgi:hypothetical protein
LSQDSVNECRPLIERIPTPSIRRGLTDWIEKQLAIASLLGLCETGMPISSDTIESLFGVAKTHGTGEIKDANRIAPRIPVLCGPLTRQDAENSLQISVDEQRAWGDCSSSLTKQRRDVLTNGGDLEELANQGEPRLSKSAVSVKQALPGFWMLSRCRCRGRNEGLVSSWLF